MISNDELLARFKRDFKRQWADNSFKTLEYAYRQLLDFHNNIPFGQLQRKDVWAFTDALFELGIKPQTVKTNINLLKKFAHYCVQEGLIDKNIFKHMKFPNDSSRNTFFPSRIDVAKIKEASLRNERDRTLIEVFAVTGLRANEITSLLIKDVHLDENVIFVWIGKGEFQRYVLFSEECSERIRNYLSSRNDDSPFLFPNRNGEAMSRQAVWKIVKKYVKISGVDVRFSPHSFRHYLANLLLEKGAPISFISFCLGHKNISTTKEYYLEKQNNKNTYDKHV